MSKLSGRLASLPAALWLAQAIQAQPSPPVSPAPVANYEYDAQGNPTAVIQAPDISGFGFVTQSSYDTLGRRKSTTDARQKTARFGYNGREDLTQVIDPRSLVTQYPRNGLSDVTTLVSPDTGTATLTYDAAGNLQTRTDGRGVLATYSYDALNRLTSIVFSKSPLPSRTVTWTYDQTGAGFANGVGRLTFKAHPDGFGQFTYDPQGRLLTDTQVLRTANATPAVKTVVGYTYDGAGNLTSITYPSGRVLTISYTGGLPSSITLAKNSGATPATLVSSIQFDPFGGPTSWTWQLAGGGTQVHKRIYDTYGRAVRYRLGPNLRDITYDAADRITNYTHYNATTGAATPSLDQSFDYDELGRLTSVTTASSRWSIGYDDNGNRSSVTLNGGSPSVYTTPRTSNMLASITNPTRNFSYDGSGNITSDTYTSTYDLAGRLSSLTKGATTETYTLDGDGKRVRKYNNSGSASTVIYVYDQSGQLLGEYGGSKPIREYVWLGNTLIAVFTPDPSAPPGNPPLIYYVHSDHLNAPRVVLDASNNIRWRWLAEPFGTNAAEENPSGLGSFAFSPRLPGQLFDAESGLHYNFFRDYDPSIGRYVQSDPIGLAGGINTYTYVKGNPLSNVDPMGLWSATIGFFPGVGGQVTVGQNPNGSGFMSVQFGWGIGGGASINPLGQAPGYCSCSGSSWTLGYGVYGQASFRAGPASASLGANLGRNANSCSNDLYGGVTKNASLKDVAKGFNASVSGGGQLTLSGGGSAQGGCTCGG